MIAEAETALNSKVEVTELEMILAEEKERDERIMKEFGIQTLNNKDTIRRPASNFNSFKRKATFSSDPVDPTTLIPLILATSCPVRPAAV
ncbi:hypothetical protein RhiirB3_460340 [Rhizophagus irregularis]|nr:hypothetical protein RhiirB3_460340 [Rhizophagus irregularis]